MDETLYKYFGLDLDTKSVRSSFLNDGLYRITQPCFLNDKFSECRLYPYFNEFSPADLAWAKRQNIADSRGPISEIPEQCLIDWYLMPLGCRLIEAFPSMLPQIDGASELRSIEEFDSFEHERIVKSLNEILVNIFSLQLGVFSLTKSDLDDAMWGRYGAEGFGMVIGFDMKHPFFQTHKPDPISYELKDRASVTYYKGATRICGYPVDFFQSLLLDVEKIFEEPTLLSALKKGLFYTKDARWSGENEMRIVFPLTASDKQLGSQLTVELAAELSHLKLVEHLKSIQAKEVCLKKIPFEAIKSVTLGYAMHKAEKDSIRQQLKNNNELHHIDIYEAEYDIKGRMIRK